jgi:predicted phage terminase large subunit-like protein
METPEKARGIETPIADGKPAPALTNPSARREISESRGAGEGGGPEKPSDLLALAREDLAVFCVAMSQGAFETAPHIKAMGAALEGVEAGSCRRLMLFCPPRHGKSEIASVHFPAWLLGRRPGASIIAASYAADLAVDFGRRVRNAIASPLYGAVFPAVRIAEDSASIQRFHTSAGGSYLAVGVGGALTGRGADLLLIDDPIRGIEDARSEASRRSLLEWYRAVAVPRLEPGGAIVLIQTRWHQSDLAGVLLSEEAASWRVLSLPALAEPDDALGRSEGAALWPERFDLAALGEIREAIGGAAWASEYQQRPAPEGGAIFREQWLQRFDLANPPAFRRIVQSWDTSFGKSEAGDYSACLTLGEAENGYFVLHVFRGRPDFPSMKRLMVELAERWRPDAILIEDSASGQSAIQELKRGSRLPIIGVKADRSKQVRAEAVSALFEAGRVFVPAPGSTGWVNALIDELLAFPSGRFDDQADALSQVLSWCRGNFSGPWTFVRVGPTRGRAAFDDDGRATRGYFESGPQEQDAEDDMQDSDPFWSGRGAY